jgi:hypothetical protein
MGFRDTQQYYSNFRYDNISAKRKMKKEDPTFKNREKTEEQFEQQ